MEPSLLIDIAKTTFAPGETIKGEILWAVDTPPEEVRVSLGWWTEGRGTKDAKIEDEKTWETQATAGKESFSLALPPTPYSFTGQLVTLKWAIELRTKKGKHSTSVDIIMSPHGTPVDLPKIDEGRKKSFSFGRNR